MTDDNKEQGVLIKVREALYKFPQMGVTGKTAETAEEEAGEWWQNHGYDILRDIEEFIAGVPDTVGSVTYFEALAQKNEYPNFDRHLSIIKKSIEQLSNAVKEK